MSNLQRSARQFWKRNFQLVIVCFYFRLNKHRKTGGTAKLRRTARRKIRKPHSKSRCNRHPCPFLWVPGQWSHVRAPAVLIINFFFINRKRIPPNYELFLQCSHSCGQGVKHRAVSCHRVNTYGWPDPDPVSHGCNSTEKPPEVETCTINAANCKTNKVMWKVGPWSQVGFASAMSDALHTTAVPACGEIFWMLVGFS